MPASPSASVGFRFAGVGAALPALSSAISLRFGPQDFSTDVPFLALPESAYHLSTWVLTPAFAFPGSGPASAYCGTFDTVTIEVRAGQVCDLAQVGASTLGGPPSGQPSESW